MSKLTAKEKTFIDEYLIDLNATEAARRAGYAVKNAKVTAFHLMAKPAIKDAVQRAMDKRANKTQITAEYVLNKIRDTVERCSQSEPVLEYNKETKELIPTGEWKFDAQSVLKGCELLGRHLKLFTDKVEHSVSDDLAERMARARARIAGNE